MKNGYLYIVPIDNSNEVANFIQCIDKVLYKYIPKSKIVHIKDDNFVIDDTNYSFKDLIKLVEFEREITTVNYDNVHNYVTIRCNRILI